MPQFSDLNLNSQERYTFWQKHQVFIKEILVELNLDILEGKACLVADVDVHQCKFVLRPNLVLGHYSKVDNEQYFSKLQLIGVGVASEPTLIRPFVIGYSSAKGTHFQLYQDTTPDQLVSVLRSFLPKYIDFGGLQGFTG